MVASEDTGRRQRRRYDSAVRVQRAQETRAALMAAAADHFLSKGWAATGMREVAASAGVAVETLYSHFPSKRALLEAVVDIAVVGDEEPVAVADRPEFAALAVGRRRDRIAAAASLITEVHGRTAGFARVLREAAPADPQIADELRATRRRQRRDTDAGFALVVGRPPTPLEGEELWALSSPELYLLFVEEAGWSSEQYEAWVTTTLERILPRS